jgi:hypothetical protein
MLKSHLDVGWPRLSFKTTIETAEAKHDALVCLVAQ